MFYSTLLALLARSARRKGPRGSEIKGFFCKERDRMGAGRRYNLGEGREGPGLGRRKRHFENR
jgi:hypothetical protein